LVGRSLADVHLPRRTGCTVVAIDHGGRVEANPDAQRPLPDGGELVLVGTDVAEARFNSEYPVARRRLRRSAVGG